MKHLKHTITLLSLLLITTIVLGQTHTIVFYNVENLYDTENDPNVRDDEFTPEGSKRWTLDKYWEKIDRLTEVFQRIAQATGGFPAVIGVCEVENRSVMQDLANGPRVRAAGYRIVHYDSPDARGMDVAFMYRPDVVEYISSKPIPVTMASNPRFRTRDILWFTGKIDGEVFHFFNNHWSSRWGGERASAPRREAAAAILRHVVDSLQRVDADANIIIMGDFNDDPSNNSIYGVLRARGDRNNLQEGDLFNPMHAMHRAGLGTLAFNDAWNLFDMIIVCQNMISGEEGRYQLYRPDRTSTTATRGRGRAREPFYGFIFNEPFLITQEGRLRGYPFRSYIGDVYQGGYSDHFPVYIYISR
jgi:hypothetical protein